MIRTPSGNTAYQLAVQRGHADVAQYIQQKGGAQGVAQVNPVYQHSAPSRAAETQPQQQQVVVVDRNRSLGRVAAEGAVSKWGAEHPCLACCCAICCSDDKNKK